MKKYLKTILLAKFALFPMLLNAQNQISVEEALTAYNNQLNDVDYLLILNALMICIVLIVIASVLRLSNRIEKLKNKAVFDTSIENEQEVGWIDLFAKRGRHVPNQVMQGHEIDGIQEYDNNPPAWFNWLFYGSIAFAVGYMLFYHVFGLGDLQIDEYNKQMARAEIQFQAAQEKSIELADAPPYTETEKLDLGKTIYAANCGMCHGDAGQGTIGPNLTDAYFIHGGKYSDIFKTIYNGVPEKGMLSWKKSLKPDEIRAVSSYVFTMIGTTPPNPKEPQGEKAE